MRIQNNIASFNAHRNLTNNTTQTSKHLEKLSSGFRINRAGDDAAGLAISEKMRGQIRGLQMASKNAQDGISLIKTAEGALEETHAILQRMRELAVQGSTQTNERGNANPITKQPSVSAAKKEASAAIKAGSAAIKAGSASKKEGSAAVKAGSAAVKQASAAVKQASATVKAASAAIKQASADIKAQSATIVKASAAALTSAAQKLSVAGKASAAVAKHTSAATKQVSATIKAQSASIKAQSATVVKASASIKTQSATVKAQSASIKTQSAILKKASADVKAGSAAIKQASATALKASAKAIDSPANPKGTGNASAALNKDIGKIQEELLALRSEVDRIAEQTEFNNMKLLDGSFKDKKFHIGANAGQNIDININAAGLKGLELSDKDGKNLMEVASQKDADAAITVIDDAITKVSVERSRLGAVQNRLEHTVKNLGTSAENLTDAESRIRDADMAKEMMGFTKNNILMQAAQSMLAQANQQPQGVLQLLQ